MSIRKRLQALDREDTDGILAFIIELVTRSEREQLAMLGNQRTPRVRMGHILEALQAYDEALLAERRAAQLDTAQAPVDFWVLSCESAGTSRDPEAAAEECPFHRSGDGYRLCKLRSELGGSGALRPDELDIPDNCPLRERAAIVLLGGQ